MSALVGARVREHATKLGLSHLAESAAELVARAEADRLGYLDFVDLLLGEELGHSVAVANELRDRGHGRRTDPSDGRWRPSQ